MEYDCWICLLWIIILPDNLQLAHVFAVVGVGMSELLKQCINDVTVQCICHYSVHLIYIILRCLVCNFIEHFCQKLVFVRFYVITVFTANACL